MPDPVGKDRKPWRKAFLFSPLLPFLDFEIEVFDIFRLAVIISLELVRPTSIPLDDLVELVKEFPVGVHACALYLSTGVADDIALEKSYSFHALKTLEHVVERLI